MPHTRNRWQEIVPAGAPPVNREAHNLVLVPDSTVVVFGGKSPTEKLSDAYTLTIPESLTGRMQWRRCEQSGTIPGARDGHSMCTVGQNIYLFGGENSEKLMLDDLYLGRLEGDRLAWTKCQYRNPPGQTPRPRRAATLTSYLNEYLILIGGEAYEELATCTMNDVWIYSIAAGTWQDVFAPVRADPGDYFAARAYHTCVPYEDKLYVFGGISHTGKVMDDLLVLSMRGEMPKQLMPEGRPLVPSVISGKDGRALMSSTKKVQYFTQYIRDTPFPVPELEEQKEPREEEAKKKVLNDISASAPEACANVAIGAVFPLEVALQSNEPTLKAFGEVIDSLEEITGNSGVDVRLEIPQTVAMVAEEIKVHATGGRQGATEAKREPETAITPEELAAASEKDLLGQFTQRMHEELRVQEKARLEPAIVFSTRGKGVDIDTFRDMLYFFGKRKDNAHGETDFGKFKLAALRIGRTLLLVSKSGGVTVHVGLFSLEYMSLIQSQTLYCPYMTLSLDKTDKANQNSNLMVLLDKMVRCSAVGLESKQKMMEYIQRMEDGVAMFVTKITPAGKKHKRLLTLEKNVDVYVGGREELGLSSDLVDYSLKTYFKYMKLTREVEVKLEGADISDEHPYVKLEKMVAARKLNRWTRSIDHLLEKGVTCSAFLFHHNLFKQTDTEEPPNIFNGVLLYYQNFLELRLLGPKLGDHVELSRKCYRRRKKLAAGISAGDLFPWCGYVKIAKMPRAEVFDAAFVCALEEKLMEFMKDIEREASGEAMTDLPTVNVKRD